MSDSLPRIGKRLLRRSNFLDPTPDSHEDKSFLSDRVLNKDNYQTSYIDHVGNVESSFPNYYFRIQMDLHRASEGTW